MAFCNPVKCIRSTNSSIVTNPKRSNTSIKTFFRRQLFKKSSSLIQSKTPIHSLIQNHVQSSGRFRRIKGSNIVREVNPNSEYSFKTNSTNNYDMTIFHDDVLDDTHVAISRRRSKKIPRWARKSQLQLAFINQIYFNDKNPEDIFGSIQIDVAHEMVQSIELKHNTEFSLNYSSSMFPPNFV
ncbi:unnamed protein product [Rotaria sordida]|uniref:Inner centromere protein ARK-binding domain-containing protein n=1 Tax=Rotaria sordida TaxID=392033 RepID=A0A818RZE2_9BILA|nr:unnamed protein product [Rotaria sordida]CAF0828894.1 unnamed protein product [Rotaria sordida]CAF0842471.1 unnamed protein product [Rotaria sordida]CAF0880002.1 unnamed protein product [Rotaria sordida]CAF0951448.1 unnamed protein product [Rotaria sordida]